MNGVRLVLALTLVTLPALALPLIRRGRHPGAWAVVTVFSIGAGFVILMAGMIHAALPLVFSLVGADGLAAACRRLGGHLFGASPVFGAGAGLLAFTVAVRAMIGVSASVQANARLRKGAVQGIPTAIAGHNAVLLPIRDRIAVAIPGPSPLVLLSQSLVEDLRMAELIVVVRHEVAHLRRHHQRFLLVGIGVGYGLWFIPWVPRAITALRLALERWADEESAISPSERKHVRSALHKLGTATSDPIHDRLKALDPLRPATTSSPLMGWSIAMSAVVPLGLALAATLVVHLTRVIQAAAIAG